MSSKRIVEETATGNAVKGFGKLVAVLIILAVAALGDVMYIVMMQRVFPAGLLLAFCYLGAFTSFLAIGYLILGKLASFRPGKQMLAAWVVFATEMVIIALNIMLVFSGDHTGLLGAWSAFSPATPVFHMLGVALVLFLDPDLGSKHADMEMQEKMDTSERQVEFETFNARIQLRRKQVAHVSKALEQAVNSPESLAYINQFGRTLNRELLIELSGMTPLSSGPQVPALLAPVSSEEAEWDVDEDWIKKVNDKMAAERAQRLADGDEDEREDDEKKK